MRATGCCREKWSVKIYVDAAGRPFLGRGWEGFASSHHLDLGDPVLFSLVWHGKFSMKVFSGGQGRIEFQFVSYHDL
ncbi:hypothetical protein QYE76_039877 [Lolium multiflorum]|uniref:TF-B3 domain-containing protein n=1 Tax=Lolium multiflorum TaxID=4521 RepID=A0AAD8TAI5_LOLMU|nr:hypothetical protein QYE76_039877 [Lolium multiflorum]